MTKRKYLFKNVSLLNVLLLIAVLIMARYTVMPLLNVSITYTLPPPKKAIQEKEITAAEHTPPSPSDYILISEQNLFHPERRIPPEKKEEVPLPKPEFVLYGTLITDTVSIAYIEDQKAPRSSPGRGKRQTALKTGDSLSGFILKEIEHDKVVMVRGEEKMIVSVYDPQKPKAREGATAPVAKTPAGKPGQPAQTPPRPAVRTRPQRMAPRTPAQPAVQQPAPSNPRVPMSPADERARQFFQRK